MKKTYFLLFFLLLSTACSSERQVFQTVRAFTPTSSTFVLTDTPSPPPSATVTRIMPSASPTMLRVQRTATPTSTRFPTRTKDPNATQPPTSTRPPTITPSPTAGPAMVLPIVTPGRIGNTIPRDVPAIGLDNFTRLANVARWGKGSILGAAFNPTGDAFVVGSAYGFAVFEMDKLKETAHWVSFEAPFFYESLFFSEDGNYLLLESWDENQVRTYPDGQLTPNTTDMRWKKGTFVSRDWGNLSLASPSGNYRLDSSTRHDEEYWEIEYSDRFIYNLQSDQSSYSINDETIQVTYWDRNTPQGCDLDSFSYCGNVYAPAGDLPYRIAFAPTEDTLAILYRPPDLFYSRYYGILRIYNVKDGNLLESFGSFDSPVETFVYAPDGKAILFADVDGSIHLWDIHQKDFIFNSWPFDAPINALAYSYDGKFLIVQRGSNLEVQRVTDGSVVSQYEATTFAVSPIDYHLAIGDKQGYLKIHSLDNGQLVFNIQAHNARIFALAYSSDGKLLASSGEDCYGKIWKATTGEFLHYLETNRTDAYGEGWTESRIFVYSLKFLPQTNQLIGSGSWGRVASWDVNSGATNYLIEPEPLEYWNGMMTLNPHFPEYFGVDVTIGHFYINEMIYNLADGSVIGPYQYPEQSPSNCAPSGPVSTDGKLRFTIGLDSLRGRICILDAQDNHLMASFEVPAQYSLIWPYLSPDGTQLIVTSDAGPVYVYQIMP